MKEEQTGLLESSQGIDPSRLNLRNKGLKTAAGRLHKGCVKDAFSKLSIGSIPSNYQSIIYRYEEKKGFGTSQKRFYNPNSMSQMLKAEIDLQDEMVAPIKKMNASHSCKGFGPLIAKEKRQWRKYPQTPGPGKYFDKKEALESQKLHKKKMNNYTRERQDFKRKQLALNKENIRNPGPGHYEVPTHSHQHSLNGCKSSFVTRTNRQAYLTKNHNPGPGWYNGAESPKETKKHQPLEEELYTKLSKEKQTLTSQFLPRQKPTEMPGPGYYDQELPNFKPLYERIKISHNFIKGGKDRLDEPLGYLRCDTKTPTACTYEVSVGYEKMQKKLIEMSSFMSESRRIVFEGQSNCSQVFYDKVKDQSKNYHFNITGKWV